MKPTCRTTDAAEIGKALLWINKRWNTPVDIEYYHARTVEEAASLLHRYGKEAKIIAGGTDLVGLMKNKVLSPGVLVNTKTIPGLHFMNENIEGLNIGASVFIRDIAQSASIKNKYPILCEAASQIGSAQIRNMGTLAGNLCQQVRCWYYRRSPDTGISFDCRRKQEQGTCYAIDGENQSHAIFGGSRCFAVCPSDIAVVLSALNARLSTFSNAGGRVIPLDDFYTSLGNVLEPDEIITGITVPEIQVGVKQRFIKFRVRKTIDFAVASVAALITFTDDMVSNARIVLGGVSPKPYRAIGAEELLRGQPLTPGLAIEAAKSAIAGARPLAKNSYKVSITEALVKRALSGFI